MSKEKNTDLPVDTAILLVKSFARAKMPSEMIMVFDLVVEKSRNRYLYNAVIDVILRLGHVDHALKLLDEMLDLKTTKPPNAGTVDVVFSHLLKTNGIVGRLKDEVGKIVIGFSKHGVNAGEYLFTQLIMRFCWNGECDKSWGFLHEVMDSECDVKASYCNALLTGLGSERDFVRMNLLMKEMKEKGIEPDVFTYGITIKHLCKVRRVDQALEILEKMKDGELGVEPNVVIYNNLIDGLRKDGRLEEGLKLMENMRLGNHCCPNTVTYNCLIDGFCKAGGIDRANDLYAQMNKGRRGCKPHYIQYFA